MRTLFFFILAFSAYAEKRPNIVILFTDDISARELPIYGSSTWSDPFREDTSDPALLAKTPVLNRLAQEGCWVETAWSATVCSPSRAMMMTGRYAHIHKWWNNKDKGMVTRKNGKQEVWPLYESSPLQLGHIAQKAGYGTFWAGKTQMAGDLDQFGYDEGCFTPGTLRDTDNPYTDFKHYNKVVDGKKVLLCADTDKPMDTYWQHGWYFYPHVKLLNQGGKKGYEWWPNTDEARANFGPHTYGPDVELDFAFEYMERQVKADKPFLIYHCSHLGHDAYDWLDPDSKSSWPGTPVVKWTGDGYERTEVKITGDEGDYDTHGTVTEPGMHSHVNYLDYQVWLYLQKFEELGIADNTLFVFTSDNGSGGYGKNSPDRQKGTHVPLIFYGKGLTKKGKQDVLVNLSDFLPTIADLTGFDIPEDYDHNGESLVPFLYGEQEAHRDWIYAYFFGKQLIRGQKVMMDARDKWWDVSETPADLISFPQITNWDSVSQEHRDERDKLKSILPEFDLHETAHDAPGTVAEKRYTAAGKKIAKNPKDKPNVVLVMADDIGLGDISFYQKQLHPNKKPTVDTPNLDSLIANGMRFSDAHSPSSLCAPTRFSMLTGNYSYRNEKGPWGVWGPENDSGIDPHFTTIARIAKKGGYQTAFFGKWGLGSSTNPNDYTSLEKGATEFGFDYALELPQGIQDEPFAFYENKKWLKSGEDSRIIPLTPQQLGYSRHVGNKNENRDGKGDSNWDPTEAGPILAQKATSYIESHADKPFFLYYCSQAVHIPHTAPEQLDGVKLAGTTAGIHGDMIRELDVQMGMLIKALKKAGVYENTLFVFTSDNGGLVIDKDMKAAGHDASNGLSGAKGSILEGGHRVPFLAVWPGTIQPNSKSGQTIVGQDMVATLAALTGQKLDRSKVKDSLNLLPLFKGQKPKERHTVLMHASIAGGHSYAIRRGPWKLVMKGTRNYDPDKLEPVALYNLAKNRKEGPAHNLIKKEAQQERVAKLLARYREFRETGAPTVN